MKDAHDWTNLFTHKDFANADDVRPFLHMLFLKAQADALEHASGLMLDWLVHPDHYAGLNAWELPLVHADKLDHGKRLENFREAKKDLLEQCKLVSIPAPSPEAEKIDELPPAA